MPEKNVGGERKEKSGTVKRTVAAAWWGQSWRQETLVPDHTTRNRLNKLLRSIKNAMITPTTSLSFLPRSDGSASFSQGRTSVIASVNGPMEVRIRDELPQEAYVEVIVRPAIGVTSMPLLSSLAIFFHLP